MRRRLAIFWQGTLKSGHQRPLPSGLRWRMLKSPLPISQRLSPSSEITLSFLRISSGLAAIQPKGISSSAAKARCKADSAWRIW